MSVGLNVNCNFERCREVAQHLGRMYLPVPKEAVPQLPFNQAEEANFWFLLAAICHQTSPTGLPALEGVIEGQHHRGWDYLVHAFRLASVLDRTLLSPERWKAFTEELLCEVFSNLLSENEVRGHLRIGTVNLVGELRERVLAGVAVSSEEDIAIRMAVRDAIQEIAVAAGNSPNALHYFFWNLFRTYCTRVTPKCDGSEFGRLPQSYAESVESSGSYECPFTTICDSAHSARALDEHKVVTDFY